MRAVAWSRPRSSSLADLVEVRFSPTQATVHNIVLLVLLGGLIGLAVDLARRGLEREEQVLLERERLHERERIARVVHDGVLQSLAYIHRRGERDRRRGGRAVGASPPSRSARCAASSPAPGRPTASTPADLRGVEGAEVDLRVLLTARERPDVARVGAGRPGASSTALVAAEVDAAVAAALDNVARHAGPGAQAWVLLEDDAARHRGHRARRRRRCRRWPTCSGAAERGRMGVSASIRGRVEDLGGTVTWSTRPGGGCVVRMTVPRTGAPRPAAPARPRPPEPGASMTDPTAPDGSTGASARDGRARPCSSPTTTRCGARRSSATSPATAWPWWPRPSDGPATVRRTRATRPDVLVLDLNLPGLRGDEVCRGPRRPADPGAHPLGERRAARRARGDQGRRHRLPGEVGVGRRAPRGRARHGRAARRSSRPGWPGWCSASSAGWPASPSRATPRHDAAADPELTERETEVLRLVAKGMSYKEIAERLVLSHRTVQNHVQNTLGKLHLHNRVELVRFALERGLDDDPLTGSGTGSRGRRSPHGIRDAGRPGGSGGATATYP